LATPEGDEIKYRRINDSIAEEGDTLDEDN
jgi:hypothetical protein